LCEDLPISGFITGMGLLPGDKQFVKHEEPEISSLSADCLPARHELSRI